MAGIIVAGKRNDGLNASGIIAQGGEDTFALGQWKETITNLLGLGDYYNAARQGRIFSVATAVGATLNGQTNPLGAGGTPLIALRNPVGSGVAAVILSASCGIVIGASATTAMPCWNIIPSSTPHGITAAGTFSAVSQRLDGATSLIATHIGTALTGSILSTFLRDWHGFQAEARHAGAASETGVNMITENTNGSIVVPPGAVLIPNIAAAGAALTGCVSIVFAEVPYGV